MDNPGKLVLGGRYRLMERIAAGTMSYIFLAEDLRHDNRRVAVKVLDGGKPDGFGEVMFDRETTALARLTHPNVIRIIDYNVAQELQWFYIVLEYLPQSLLDEIAARPTGRDDEWSLPLLRQLAEAVDYAHGENVIHRDLKPGNVLLTAEGIPKVTDFGISRLKGRLSHGRTVAHFRSQGYASPEQRADRVCDERSDLYSLGVLFHHVLTGQAPPDDGLSPTVADALDTHPNIRRLVKRMIDPDPGRRPGTALEVVRALRSAERQSTPPPQCVLVISRPARAQLIERGADPADLETWLTGELGSPDDAPSSVIFSPRGVTLLTEWLRLRCERQPRSSLLEIASVDTLPMASLATQRDRALAPRIAWQPILFEAPEIPMADREESSRTLDDLFDSLRHHMEMQRDERDRMGSRRDLVAVWEKILRLRYTLLLQSGGPLAYTSVEEGPDTLRFNLREVVPDDHSWDEDTPLAVQTDAQTLQLVGTLRRIAGKQILVSRPPRVASRGGSPDRAIPQDGMLQRFMAEESSSLGRQRAALRSLRYGETVNPRLVDILVDLRRADFDAPDDDIAFIQTSLEPEKQAAVRAALAARDLFLLQGPPGTGKTTVIAEIVLQILRVQPDARILLTSQSNAAVDHALDRVAALHNGRPLEIVRLGREERIGHRGRNWLLEQRREQWRSEVVAHCADVIEALRGPQDGRATATAIPTGPTREDLDQCRDWIEEAREWVGALCADEERLAALSPHDTPENAVEERSLIARERAALRAAIAVRETAIADQLAAIRDLSTPSPDDTPIDDPVLEIDRLLARIAARQEAEGTNPSTHALRALVSEWSEVFGRTEDFDVPILKRANIVAATCLTAGRKLVRGFDFDWTIVDEAGRATAPEVLVPLVRARRAILVGDGRQLPPIVDRDLSPEQLDAADVTREELQTSLFETLVRAAERTRPEMAHMLRSQHRMHPAIGRLVSDVFYDGKLIHAAETEQLEHDLPWLDRRVLWLSTSQERGRRESRYGKSFASEKEAAAIAGFLRRVEDSYRLGGTRRSVGVITGYTGQSALLTSLLSPTDRERWQALDLDVDTVDAFQGRECDIIIFSAVRSNYRQLLGFLSDRRRLNVALSRARQLLVIVGDAEMLRRAEPDRPDNPFRDVLRYIAAHPDDCRIEPVASG